MQLTESSSILLSIVEFDHGQIIIFEIDFPNTYQICSCVLQRQHQTVNVLTC